MVGAGSTRTPDATRFHGLSHTEALGLEVPPTQELVENLIEAGTLGTIAGLPNTFKSFLGLGVTYKVAAGGRVLGNEVLQTGPTASWWQDDSEANALRRMQAYAAAHGLPDDLPIRWHFNEGLVLPDNLDVLREEIEREGQRFVLLDSLYNFLRGKSLKEEEIGSIYSQLKAEVCDPTGCTIATVDHAPWPTEGNRGQRRSYGSVFKTAAIRWGIYTAPKTIGEIWLEAKGNNMPGLKSTLCTFDAELLELKPIAQKANSAPLVREWRELNPGGTQKEAVVELGLSRATVQRHWNETDETDQPALELFDGGLE
jgi:hypothetical protein